MYRTETLTETLPLAELTRASAIPRNLSPTAANAAVTAIAGPARPTSSTLRKCSPVIPWRGSRASGSFRTRLYAIASPPRRKRPKRDGRCWPGYARRSTRNCWRSNGSIPQPCLFSPEPVSLARKAPAPGTRVFRAATRTGCGLRSKRSASTSAPSARNCFTTN